MEEAALVKLPNIAGEAFIIMNYSASLQPFHMPYNTALQLGRGWTIATLAIVALAVLMLCWSQGCIRHCKCVLC
jgi:hypothetical protein